VAKKYKTGFIITYHFLLFIPIISFDGTKEKKKVKAPFLFFWSRFSFLFLKEKKRVERKVWLRFTFHASRFTSCITLDID
jgi:hypothetical protein